MLSNPLAVGAVRSELNAVFHPAQRVLSFPLLPGSSLLRFSFPEGLREAAPSPAFERLELAGNRIAQIPVNIHCFVVAD